MLFTSGACLFTLLVSKWFGKTKHGSSRDFAFAEAVWYETNKKHGCVVVWGGFLLILYSNTAPLSCMVVSDHLRFHFNTAQNPAVMYLVVLMHLWMVLLARQFHRKHGKHMNPMVSPCGAQPELSIASGPRAQHVRPVYSALSCSMVHSLWLMVCVLTSAPGVLYSAVHSVPGFLRLSADSHWIANSTV
eukprot:5093524-Amphidinium_carterae.1